MEVGEGGWREEGRGGREREEGGMGERGGRVEGGGGGGERVVKSSPSLLIQYP